MIGPSGPRTATTASSDAIAAIVPAAPHAAASPITWPAERDWLGTDTGTSCTCLVCPLAISVAIVSGVLEVAMELMTREPTTGGCPSPCRSRRNTSSVA